MTTTFTINNHTAIYGDADSGPVLSGYRVAGYCDDCGPDGADFYAATDGDFYEQFLAHAERVS